MSGFTLPANEDYERAAVGSLAVNLGADPLYLANFNGSLTPDLFYIDRYRFVYEALRAIYDRGELVTMHSLSTELKKRLRYEDVGGVEFIGQLYNEPDLVHADFYIDELNKLAQARAAKKFQLELDQRIGRLRAKAELTPDEAQELADLYRSHADAVEGQVIAKPQPPDPWQFRTLADAYKPRPPLTFLISGLIAVGYLIILYGAPGTLKSMLLAYLAVCVAAGLPALGPLPNQPGLARVVTQAAVMWLDFDNGKRRTDERFDALGKALAVAAHVPLHYISMPNPFLNADDHASIVNLADRIIARNARLVIIDNLGTISGNADENSAEMRPVMDNLRWLTEFTGATLIVIHHQRKSNGFVSRAGESLRGHSSIEAAIDLALLVEREERSSLLTIKSTKTRDVDVPPFGAHFVFEHTAEGDELATARFWGMPVEDTKSDHAVQAAILDAVKEHHPVNGTKLVAAVRAALPDIGTNRIRKLANDLVADSKLIATSGDNNARLYDLP